MGYEDWTHARHVTNLNGCKRHLIALLKVELDADALERLRTEGSIKNVGASSKQIWQVIPAKLLKVSRHASYLYRPGSDCISGGKPG